MSINIKNISFRAACADDLARVLIIENLVQLTPWTLNVFNMSLFTDECFNLAINTQKNEIVGFIICAVYAPEAEITNFGVHPDYQNIGIGKLLLTNLFDKLKLKDIEKINLEVRLSNDRAINFYKTQKFVIVGKRKKYYQTNIPQIFEDGFLMTKLGV